MKLYFISALDFKRFTPYFLCISSRHTNYMTMVGSLRTVKPHMYGPYIWRSHLGKFSPSRSAMESLERPRSSIAGCHLTRRLTGWWRIWVLPGYAELVVLGLSVCYVIYQQKEGWSCHGLSRTLSMVSRRSTVYTINTTGCRTLDMLSCINCISICSLVWFNVCPCVPLVTSTYPCTVLLADVHSVLNASFTTA